MSLRLQANLTGRNGNTLENIMPAPLQAPALLQAKEAPQPAKPELSDNYRPIGLKAVIAAALMLKRAPIKKVA